MDKQDWLAERFETNRTHLKAVAYRMLGSFSEADDAVQESWLRLNRADAAGIENLRGWLTTVVARVCLDILRARKTRREEAMDTPRPLSTVIDSGSNPEGEALLAESVSEALLVVLDTLAPAERVAFVLHDMFAMPYEDLAPIVGRSPEATRQLASRGRRRVQGGAGASDPDRARRREIVDAFLAASRDGDFDALLALLDPDIVLRADHVAVQTSQSKQRLGAPKLAPDVRGAAAVAEAFSGRASAAQPALVNGSVGAAWAPGGTPRSVYTFTIARGKIVAIDVVADPRHLRELEVEILNK
jgi:RNA polymerase sigma-70 factor (ECF subfamily)